MNNAQVSNRNSILMWCSHHKKDIARVAVGLTAITALVFGILVIIAQSSISPSCLNAFSHAGAKTGPFLLVLSVAIGIGGVVFLTPLVSVLYDKYPILEPKRNENSSFYLNLRRNYEKIDEPFKSAFLDVAKKLEIKDIPSALGNEDLFILIQRKQIESFKKTARIALLNHEQISHLKQSEITQFIPQEIDMLQQKLYLFEKGEIDSPDTETLAAFRKLSDTDLSSFSIEKNRVLFGLLAPRQIHALLANPLFDGLTITDILPLSPDGTLRRSHQFLQSLKIEEVQKYIHSLSGKHLRHLSDEVYKDPEFPWDKLRPVQIKNLFCDQEKGEKVKAWFSLLNMDTIAIILPHLSMYYFYNISEEQWKNDAFPWDKLTKEQVMVHFPLLDPKVCDSTDKKLKCLSTETQKILIPKGLTRAHFHWMKEEERQILFPNCQ